MIDTKKLLYSFIEEIHKEYKKARTIYKKDSGRNVYRGRSRCISAIAEDLFASLIASCIGNDLYYFVDQPIRLTTDDKKTNIVCPDLLICKKCENIYQILYMIDLKTDIGWFRADFDSKMTLINNNKEKIHNAKRLTGKDGINKKEILEFCAKNKPEYDMVIVSAENSGGTEKKEKILKKIDSNNNVWVLSSGSHPNDYDNYEMPKCRYDDFIKLINKIKSYI